METHYKLAVLLTLQILYSVTLVSCVIETKTPRPLVLENWTGTIAKFMSLFQVCKIQMVVESMKETDEMLALADYYATTLQTGILLHSVYDDDYSDQSKILFPSQYKPSSYRNNGAEGWRYTRCYVQLFPSEFLRARTHKFPFTTLLNKLPIILEATRDNPSYLLLLLQHYRFEDELAYAQAVPSLIRPAISSIYVSVINGKFIDIICIPCFQQNGYPSRGFMKSYITATIPVSLEDLETKWQQGNKNLFLGPVLWMGLREKTQCHPLKDRLHVPQNECTLLVMKEKLNFTIVGDSGYEQLDAKNRSQFTLGKICATGYSDTYLIQFILQHYNYEAFEWSPLGSVTQTYGMIAVLDVHKINISAFWCAFDIPLWICTLATAILSTVTLVALTNHNPSFRSVLGVFAVVLGFLIDHSIMYMEKKYVRATTSAALLLFLWAQVAMIVSSGYRGALFSLLASAPIPAIPQGMEELASYEDLVLTNAAYFSGRGKPANSLLHATINEFLEATEFLSLKPVYYVRKNAKEFGKKLVFVNSSISQILYAQTKKGADYVLQRSGKGHPINLPPNYIILLSNSLSSMYSMLLHEIGENIIILQGNELPLLTQHMPLIIRRNFFVHQYTRVLYGLMESGMWSRWGRYYSLFEFRQHRHRLWEYMKYKATETMEPPNRNILAALFEGSGSTWGARSSRPIENARLYLLQPIFWLYFAMVAVSFVQLVLEVIYWNINLSHQSAIPAIVRKLMLRQLKQQIQDSVYI